MVIKFTNPLQAVITAYRRSAITVIIFIITVIQFCYSAFAGLCHFCIALTVTRKFRLCLHPEGCSVSSRYTFPKGLARRCLHIVLIYYCFKKQLSTIQHLAVYFPSLHSRLRSANTAPALRQRVRVEASSPSTTAFCRSLTRADSSNSASWDSSQLTGSE